MKRIIAFLLIALMLPALLVSCVEKRDSELVATFDGGYIYADDSDYSDLYNLNMYYYSNETGADAMGSYEYNTVKSLAVKSTVTMRILEDEIARRGYSVDMAEVEANARRDEEIFENAYKGGFAAFLEDWDLSEEVFVTFNKLKAMQDIAKEFFVTIEKVNETDAHEYFVENGDDFVNEPHFEVNTIFLQVNDPSKRFNHTAVYLDALIYIEMLNSGKPWSSVANTASMKYNIDNGMIFSHYLTGINKISKSDFIYIYDLKTELNALSERFESENGVKFEEMFSDGFEKYVKDNGLVKNTKSYNEAWEKYMNYCSDKFMLEFRNAITEHWRSGNTYSKPLYHGGYNCYVVLTFAHKEDDMVDEVTFESVRDDIIAKLTDERKSEAYDDFISRKLYEARVQIKYN